MIQRPVLALPSDWQSRNVGILRGPCVLCSDTESEVSWKGLGEAMNLACSATI